MTKQKQREGVIYKIIYNKKIIYIGRSLDYKTRLRSYKSKIYDKTNSSYNNKLFKFLRENVCQIKIINRYVKLLINTTIWCKL